MKRSHPAGSRPFFAVFLFMVLSAGFLIPAAHGQFTNVMIGGFVINDSDWSNQSTNAPFHWAVPPFDGEEGKGRVMVEISSTFGTVGVEYLEPAGDPFALSPMPFTVGTNWPFAMEVAYGGTYTITAWIDGNDNRQHDEGEPVGTSESEIEATIDSLFNFITIEDDTDNDGLKDWWEVHFFGNLGQVGFTDYDNDGLSNSEEHDLAVYLVDGPELAEISPSNWDTDGDQMDDGWEHLYGLDPTDATGVNGATGHRDSDGLNNYFEYRGPDGIGPKIDGGGGVAITTSSRDAMNPNLEDTDDDEVDDNIEVLDDLTHPVHSMNSTNWYPRSLSMGAVSNVELKGINGSRVFGESGFTIEFWLNPGNDGDGTIFHFPNLSDPDGDDHFKIDLVDFRPHMVILNGTNGITYAEVGGVQDSVEQLPQNEWSHVACVWAPDNSSLELYVDGILLIASKTFVKPNITVGPPQVISDFTDGYLDELRVWDYPRSVSDIEYWSTRIYPALDEYVLLTSQTFVGGTMENYDFGRCLFAYYRFDDAGTSVENYARLNDTNYYLSGAAVGVTTNTAAVVYGSDDADGDELPEWWVSIHNLDDYLEYYSSRSGPWYIPCNDDPSLIDDFYFFRSFTAYGSIGNAKGWAEDSEDPESEFLYPKTRVDFFEGVHSSYMKYLYLRGQPIESRLNIFTPGMLETAVYVNGQRLTPDGAEANTLQSYDVSSALRIGRNVVFVECMSEFELYSFPVGATLEDYLAADPSITSFLDCQEEPYLFKTAIGKFDASMSYNGRDVIVRGDHTRADPRAVWHCQFWSTGAEALSYFPAPDQSARSLPGNQEYGLPANAERENNPLDPDLSDDFLDANYEYIAGTNPRDRDSNNNGVPDGDEDFDQDQLINSEEQAFSSDPWLKDTDDDGLLDGMDVGANGHPSESQSPQKSQSLYFGGTTNDYMTMPKNQRFGLEKWTIEGWVRPAATEVDGGILIQRMVDTNAVNYELGLGDGTVAPANTPYVRFVPNFGGAEVVTSAPDPVVSDGDTWTHLAASYYDHTLVLFVNGTNVSQISGTTSVPAVFAGGPIAQVVGKGIEGWIDDVRIWGIDRDDEDIAETMENVLTGLEDDLVAYYRFDDGTSYTNLGATVVGTSANNGTNGLDNVVPWTWGQVEEYVLKYAVDWATQWAHGGTLYGAVSFSSEFKVAGPPQLQVFIEPDDAVEAGAQWSHNSGITWNESGHLETHLDAETFEISFQSIEGWIAPDSETVSLSNGVLTVLTNRYVEAASLTVIINNDSDEVVATALWSINNGLTWYSSGERVENLVPGENIQLEFSDISDSVPGYLKPDAQVIVLEEGEHEIVSVEYPPILGRVRITLGPDAVSTEAQWRIAGNWYVSGATASNLAYGSHTVDYLEITGWDEPDSEVVTISDTTLIALEREYTREPEPTGMRVFIEPSDAVLAGAQWRVEQGSLQDSGELVTLSPADYNVYFTDLDGWQAPDSQLVNVTNDITTLVTGAYYRLEIIGRFGPGLGDFNKPRGVAITDRYLYVSDSEHDRVQLFDLTTSNWTEYAAATGAIFNQPSGIAVDPSGDIWVADANNHRIQRLTVSSGVWTPYGSFGSGSGQLDGPFDLDVDSSGNVYVADYYNHRVQVRTSAGAWFTLAGNGTQDGQVRFPTAVAVGPDDHVFIADYDTESGGAEATTRIQEFDENGDFVAIVGDSSEDRGDLNRVMGLEVGTNSNLLVANSGDDELLELDLSGGTPAWVLKLGPSQLDNPSDVDIDMHGSIYIADTDHHRVLVLPADDSDGDGSKDVEERIAGTNPHDEDEIFAIVSQRLEGDSVVITWSSVTDHLYTLSVTENLKDGPWVDIIDCSDVPGTGDLMSYTNTTPSTMRFYRVSVREAE